MRPTLLAVFLACVATAPLAADTLVEFEGEVEMPLAEGWRVQDSTFPVLIVHDELPADLAVYRSVISSDETIDSPGDLKVAVDVILEDVILTQPEASLLTNTGYHEDNRAWFEIEYETWDSTVELPLYHRLAGSIYRHPDGYQLLFTTWGKVMAPLAPAVADDFRSMQDGFVYTGPAMAEVFATNNRNSWWYVAILVPLAGLLLLFRSRRRKNARATGSSPYGDAATAVGSPSDVLKNSH